MQCQRQASVSGKCDVGAPINALGLRRRLSSSQGHTGEPDASHTNQDNLVVVEGIGNIARRCLFAVFDGHGPSGNQASVSSATLPRQRQAPVPPTQLARGNIWSINSPSPSMFSAPFAGVRSGLASRCFGERSPVSGPPGRCHGRRLPQAAPEVLGGVVSVMRPTAVAREVRLCRLIISPEPWLHVCCVPAAPKLAIGSWTAKSAGPLAWPSSSTVTP